MEYRGFYTQQEIIYYEKILFTEYYYMNFEKYEKYENWKCLSFNFNYNKKTFIMKKYDNRKVI